MAKTANNSTSLVNDLKSRFESREPESSPLYICLMAYLEYLGFEETTAREFEKKFLKITVFQTAILIEWNGVEICRCNYATILSEEDKTLTALLHS